MTNHVHGDRPGHSGPFQVPDGRSTKIVRNPTGTASLSTRRPPRLDEALDSDSIAVKYPWHDPSLELQSIRLDSLATKEVFKLVGEREDPRLTALGRARSQPELSPLPVYVRPLKRQYLGINSPAGVIGALDDGGNWGGEMPTDRVKLFAVKETGSRRCLGQQRNVWPTSEFLVLDGQVEHPLQGRQLSVDFPIRYALSFFRDNLNLPSHLNRPSFSGDDDVRLSLRNESIDVRRPNC